jgi:ribonuclease J
MMYFLRMPNMQIEIQAIGGYDEVGKNMTAIRIGEEIYICDMGIHLENYIRYTEDEDIKKFTPQELIDAGALPDDRVLKRKDQVKLILPTHAHLDHIGALPFLARRYDAPILSTPFSIAVLNKILEDSKIRLKNPIKAINVNSSYEASPNVQIEFINMTHSTPQTCMVAFHTPVGVILYANDFKFDNYPTLGQKPNYKKLEDIGKKNVLALIVDSTYSREAQKMPSEMVAKQMLRDVLLATNNRKNLIVITTFSSHIARIQSIIEMGKLLKREIIFLGRSLAKYTESAEEIGIVQFSNEVEIVKYGNKIQKRLKKISPEKRGKYLLVVTGHQGEPRSVLSRLANGVLGFDLEEGDHVIFSSKIIPTETNRKNREILEAKLMQKKVRVFKDIHVSGHAAREDLRDLVNLVKPRYILPAHGDKIITSGMVNLAREMNYKENEIIQLRNGDSVRIL